jgi:4-amino-4-deoxy-L-arabinose transferase-like glycosyltransferase
MNAAPPGPAQQLPASPRSGSAVLGWGLLAAALLFYWSSVAAVPPAATPGWDLQPEPDAPEYFAGALSLAQGEGYRIRVAGRSLPPRYPPGYSLLQAVAMRAGVAPLDAPFVVNRMAGLLLILCVFTWLWRHGRPDAGGLAALLTVTSPAFIVTTRSPMSEPLSGLLAVAAVLWLYHGLERRHLPSAAAAGFLLGLSTLVRISNVIMAAAFAAAPVVAGGPLRNRLQLLAGYLAGLAVGLLPSGVYNWWTFGSPLTTGYDFWVPFYGRWAKAFTLQAVPRNAQYFLGELLELKTTTTVADLYGEGSYLTLVLAALTLLSIWVFRRRRSVPAMALCGILSVLPFLFYVFQDARLIYPQLAVLPLPIAAGSLRLLRDPARRTLRLFTAGLLLAQLAIFPGAHGDPDFDRYLRGTRKVSRPRFHDLVSYLETVRDRGPVLVLTDMNPAYVHALLSGDRVVVPAVRSHDYRWGSLRFDEAERMDYLQRAVRERRQILLLLKPPGTSEMPAPPPLPAGWRWRVVTQSPDSGLVSVGVPVMEGS